MSATHSLLSAGHAPCGLIALSEDGYILDLNERMAEMLGYSEQALRGKHVDVLFRAAPRLLFHTHVLPLLKMQGRVDELELPLKQADQQEIDTLLSATRELEGGQAVLRFAFFRLRERRRLEDELFNAKRAAEQAPGLLFQLRRRPDGHTSFTYCTDAIASLYGVTPRQAQASADPVWRRLHPLDAPRVLAELDISARGMTIWRSEYRVVLDEHDGGEQWRETHAVPQRERDGSVLWNGYTSDITERKALDAATRDKETAERATAAKSAFLARISHELRTPLNGILGFARLLRISAAQRLVSDDLLALSMIESSGQHLLDLINELLDIARIEAGRMEVHLADVDVGELAHDALRLQEPLARERHIETAMAPLSEACWARADAQRLRQCLTNLISNAIKYNRSRGRVSLRVQRSDALVRIEVADQGPGFSAEQRAQLFQPYNRLKADSSGTEGTGLGLVITRNLIELMGGHLELHSQPDQGSCFCIVLPAAEPAVAEPAHPIGEEAGSDPRDNTGFASPSSHA